MTAVVFTKGLSAALAWRGYKAVGGEFMLLLLPIIYYEAKRIIGVLGTILGGVLSYAAFHRNSKKDSESEGKEAGTMLTEIGYIKGGIDRIERKQDAQDARYIGMAERMSAVESSAKSAHHRIDRLEGREAREDG